MNKNVTRGVVIPAVAVIITAINFSNISNSDCIRAIHVVSLLVMGFALGVLVMNLVTLYKNSKITS